MMKIPAHLRTRLAAGVLFAALLSAATVVPAAAQLRTSTTTPAPVLTADDLFVQSVVRDLRLTMKASDWDALVEHYLEDTYYRADMEWEGQVVPIVGVRSRGSGSRNPYKPGLKIAFAEYVDQRFLGLKSVVLANAIQDPSMLRQRASMAFLPGWACPPRGSLTCASSSTSGEPRRVISNDTARTLTGLLEGVVLRGTGRQARVPGYRIAGKTGTAQKVIPGTGYSPSQYIASFGGFGPIRSPRLVALVALDSTAGRSTREAWLRHRCSSAS